MSANVSANEQRCERVLAALAEVLPSDLLPESVRVDDEDVIRWNPQVVTPAMAWRAAMIADPTEVRACWPCWEADFWTARERCTHDPLTSPWPEVVR